MLGGLFNWICIFFGMTGLAFFWLAYLIKIVLNDEVVLEKTRRRARDREIQRRHDEETARRNQIQKRLVAAGRGS